MFVLFTFVPPFTTVPSATSRFVYSNPAKIAGRTMLVESGVVKSVNQRTPPVGRAAATSCAATDVSKSTCTEGNKD